MKKTSPESKQIFNYRPSSTQGGGVKKEKREPSKTDSSTKTHTPTESGARGKRKMRVSAVGTEVRSTKAKTRRKEGGRGGADQLVLFEFSPSSQVITQGLKVEGV